MLNHWLLLALEELPAPQTLSDVLACCSRKPCQTISTVTRLPLTATQPVGLTSPPAESPVAAPFSPRSHCHRSQVVSCNAVQVPRSQRVAGAGKGEPVAAPNPVIV